jgi:hypothetical protein
LLRGVISLRHGAVLLRHCEASDSYRAWISSGGTVSPVWAGTGSRRVPRSYAEPSLVVDRRSPWCTATELQFRPHVHLRALASFGLFESMGRLAADRLRRYGVLLIAGSEGPPRLKNPGPLGKDWQSSTGLNAPSNADAVRDARKAHAPLARRPLTFNLTCHLNQIEIWWPLFCGRIAV